MLLERVPLQETEPVLRLALEKPAMLEQDSTCSLQERSPLQLIGLPARVLPICLLGLDLLDHFRAFHLIHSPDHDRVQSSRFQPLTPVLFDQASHCVSSRCSDHRPAVELSSETLSSDLR